MIQVSCLIMKDIHIVLVSSQVLLFYETVDTSFDHGYAGLEMFRDGFDCLVLELLVMQLFLRLHDTNDGRVQRRLAVCLDHRLGAFRLLSLIIGGVVSEEDKTVVAQKSAYRFLYLDGVNVDSECSVGEVSVEKEHVVIVYFFADGMLSKHTLLAACQTLQRPSQFNIICTL